MIVWSEKLYIGEQAQKQQKKVQKKLDALLGITRENLNGVRVIRAFNRSEAEVDAFEDANSELNGLQKFVDVLETVLAR